MMRVIDLVRKARSDYMGEKNKIPMTVCITYEQGVSALECIVAENILPNCNEIEMMLIRGDEKEIKEHLSNMYMFGMKIIIADVIACDSNG